MKHVKLSVVLLVIALTLCSCAPDNSQVQVQEPDSSASNLPAGSGSDVVEPVAIPAELDLDGLLEIALNNHAYLFQPIEDKQAEEFLAPFADGIDPEKDIATAAVLRALYQGGGAMPSESVTQAQAQEDIGFLMDYLECAYAGYVYLGGAEIFDPLRTELVVAVSRMGDTVAYDDFVTCLREVLYPALPDMHFRIDWQRDREAPVPYTIPELFYGDGETFVEAESQQVLNSLSVDGEDCHPRDLLVPWVNPEGQLCYRPIIQSFNEPSVELLFDSGARPAVAEPIVTSFPQQNGDLLWELEQVEDIPVLHCYSLNPENGDMTPLEEFAASALSIRDAPYIIVDLRGNGGGFAPASAEWLGNLTGRDADDFMSIGISATAYSETVYANYPSSMMGTWYYDAYDNFKEGGDFPGYAVDGETRAYTPVETDQTIFVLMDETTGSAAEYFANYLAMLDHTVLVGSPTGGYFHFGNVIFFPLLNSGISVSCGFNVYLLPDLKLHDGVGFTPDLWCNSDEAMDAVIELIKQTKK